MVSANKRDLRRDKLYVKFKLIVKDKVYGKKREQVTYKSKNSFGGDKHNFSSVHQISIAEMKN